MKYRKFITRYAKLISSPCSRLVQFDREKEISFPDSPSTVFYKKLLKRLVCNTFMLYPVRVSEVYVLTYNGYHEIFSSKSKILDFLEKNSLVLPSENLRNEFNKKNADLLDLEKISTFIPNSKVESIPIKEYMVTEDDVLFEELSSISSLSAITFTPCLHEELTLVEVFLETAFLTENIRKKMRKFEYTEIESAFSFPPEVFDEVLSSLGVNIHF